MVDRTHDETKLWESFIKGETAAFEEVYRRYYSLLYSYGIRMVGDRELVADTIQNLFVKLILNCRNLHYTDNVKAYLLCSFRNKLLDPFTKSPMTSPLTASLLIGFKLNALF